MIRYRFLIKNECWCKLLNNIKQLPTAENKFYSSDAVTSSKKINPNHEADDSKENEDSDLLDSKRKKSGLNPYHYAMHHKKVPPYTEDELEVMSLWQYRRMYGKYGSAANIDMKSLWPSVREMEFVKEREKIEYPHTVQEMIKMAKEERMEKERSIMERQREIQEKVKTLEKWKLDIKRRVEKKEEEAKLASEKKQKQIEEVREILGYKISPHDPKFLEVLEKKQAEDKKKAKKERKLRKQQQLVERLNEMAKQAMVDEPQPDPLYGEKIE